MGSESDTIEQPELLNSKYSELNNIKIRSVSAGFDHTLIVSEDNKVYGLGKSESGQLGMGTKVTRVDKPTLISSLINHHIEVKEACCGGHHSLILSSTFQFLSLNRNI
jgi:alpha-tubulin suppressor-like RCC1 family protein